MNHEIKVKSIQEWHGRITPGMLKPDFTAPTDDLEFQKERSLSFECECGERFLKWDTAKQHLQGTE